jgi:hypothetical protein
VGGEYIVDRLPAAPYTVVVRHAGFAPDSFNFTMRDGESVSHDVILSLSTRALERVVINALAKTRPCRLIPKRCVSESITAPSVD